MAQRKASSLLLGGCGCMVAVLAALVTFGLWGISSNRADEKDRYERLEAARLERKGSADGGAAKEEPAGYKGVAWGETPAATRKKLPPRGAVAAGECALNTRIPAHRLEHILMAVGNLADTDETILSAEQGKTLAALGYSQTLSADYEVTRVGTGCGLFFNHRYFAQVNLVDEALAEQDVVAEIVRGLQAESAVSRGTTRVRKWLEVSVHTVEARGTLAVILHAPNSVFTVYIGRTELAAIPSRAAALARQRAAEEATRDAATRKANAKKHLGDL